MNQARTREPVFSAPWPALAIAAVIIVGYMIQLQIEDPGFGQTFGLVPALAVRGAWSQFLTHMFVHGSWSHAIFNALWGLVFATPVARLLGQSGARALAFFGFYLFCGALTGVIYAYADVAAFAAAPGLSVDPQAPVVGASGAIAALTGASARLLGGHGRLGPLISRLSVGLAGAWILTNLLVGLGGLPILTGGAHVAWQVHIIGFFVGLFAIGPWTALFGPKPREAGADLASPISGR